MSDYLPIDVLVEILSRLPVKPLLRFTSVCKKWYSLILNPNFVSKHLEQSISEPSFQNQFLLVRHYNILTKRERFALHFDNPFVTYAELQCPFTRVNDFFRVVGTCNGLICLADDIDTYTDTVIIWNPCARKSINLPKPVFSNRPQGTVLLGFGFDSVNNDYKIVRIVYFLNIPGDHHYRVPPQVEIYALSTRVWRSICNVAPMYDIFSYFPSPAFVNGHLHWVASKYREDGSFHNFLSGFDMSAEVFREVMMPESLAETEILKLAVLAWDTSLALVQYEKIWQSDYCWVWKMNEYNAVESWARLFAIDMREGIRTVVSLQRTNRVIMSARAKGLIMYHPNTQKIQSLGIHGTNRSLYMDSFVESLVLVEGRNRALLELGSSNGGVVDHEMSSLVLEDDTETNVQVQP